MNPTLLGIDLGSSSVKVALLDSVTGEVLASSSSPETELEISALKPGWAEQQPELWWEHTSIAIRALGRQLSLASVAAVGVGYQMHGLVALDNNLQPVRSSIIWCDSRAVELGDTAFKDLGKDWCLNNLLNSPGNFTASKLAWVKKNEPKVFDKIHYIMLPGDYLITRLTGRPSTSFSGLSEGIFWNFKESRIADQLLEYFGVSKSLFPKTYPAFGEQGVIRDDISKELGLPLNLPITYRAGDQPNNAFALKVLNPGEIGANAGTSGVVYGVADKPVVDGDSRVNTFLHVTDSPEAKRLGVLLCVNGAGALSRWVKANFSKDYKTLDREALEAKIGSKGLSFLPYGNGAERTLANKNIGASLHGLELNIHSSGDVYRAALEGIACALNYGVGIMREMGIEVSSMRAGYGNMFKSPVFSEALAAMVGVPIELYQTDGAEGAARGAGFGAGVFSSIEETFKGLRTKGSVVPTKQEAYSEVYQRWLSVLNSQLD